MKHLLFLTLIGISLVGCTKKADLSTDTGKSSYAIGLQIGRGFKQQGVDVNEASLSQGISDGIAGKEQITKEEAAKAISELQQTMMKKAKDTADKAKAVSDDFLKKNETQPGVKTTASGLQYVVQKEGSGKSPDKNSTVKVNYRGTLTDGTEFDSSFKRNAPAELKLAQVIPGWSEALMLMKPGAKYKIFIPPALAYGESPRPNIPPNSTLVFDVELLEVKQ